MYENFIINHLVFFMFYNIKSINFYKKQKTSKDIFSFEVFAINLFY
jgi:hypothetical protein